MSDFPDTIAIVHAGTCPLCGGALGDEARCDRCDVAWRVQGVHDPIGRDETAFGMGPMLVASRRLTSDEQKKLYARDA